MRQVYCSPISKDCASKVSERVKQKFDFIMLITHLAINCLAIGNAKEESSGIVSAINDLVAKLEPSKNASTVIMESDTKCCVIYSGKNMNAALFKNITR